jgi:transaldolase / glucose-6-phosphate isomerase
MQLLYPGKLEAEFQRQLADLIAERAVDRLFAGDNTLWPGELIAHNPALARLDWLLLPKLLSEFLSSVEPTLRAADAEGLVDHALLSSESLNLTARSFLEFPGISPGRKVVVFDSVSPEFILSGEAQLDLRRTLFVISNKLSYGLRDHCLFLYFQDQLHQLLGDQISNHFVSETDPHSYLAALSRGYTFREVYSDPTAVPAAYCSLMQCGVFLLATRLATREQILATAAAAQAACSNSKQPAANPALQLAALLSATIGSDKPYLAFVTSPSLLAFSRRLSQIVGGGLARQWPGLIPLLDAMPRNTATYQHDAAFVFLTHPGEDNTELSDCMARLQSNGTPFVHAKIENQLCLLQEICKWETAVILSCAKFGVDPFDLADNHVPRTLASELMNRIAQGQDPLQRSARITDGLIQLYADGMTRQGISTLSLAEALRTFFRIPTPLKHIWLLVQIHPTPELRVKFAVLRRILGSVLRRPIMLAYGPLAGEQATYLFRDSLPHGLYIVFTTEPSTDKPIPGANYTFGQLHQVAALCEYDTLVHWQRPLIRLHLAPQFPEALDQLLHAFEQALHRFQS